MSEAKWYILHTFSGYEKKVADNIKKVVENRNLQHLIEEVMVPIEQDEEEANSGNLTEGDAEVQQDSSAEAVEPSEDASEGRKSKSKGKAKSKGSGNKTYPSYVFVKMVMTDESWYICRNTRGCTGFVGPGSKPVPLTDEEVAHLGVPQKPAEATFKAGDLVKIISGSLKDFEGTVKEVDEAAGTAVVTVSMFGKATPTTLELNIIQKIN